MKITVALFAALCPVVASSYAQLTAINPSYQANPYFSHTNTDSIVSYDWGSDGNVYYQTNTSGFTFGGLYQYNGSTSTQQVAASSDYTGASVVAIGQSVYYNTSDNSNQKIFQYGPLGGTAPVLTLASTAPNYGLYQNQGHLFITGAQNFGTNHIYYSDLSSSLASKPPVDLGVDSGSSGPLAFDTSGNLFYAPGFGDNSIYRWSATDVANAIQDPINHPLGAAGHQWLNYAAIYDAYSGATSMLLDQNGNLLVTLTNFGDPSLLVKFGVGANGAYDNTNSTLFQDMAALGELRLHDNDLYVSSGNEVVQIVPEPSTVCLLVLGSLLLVGYHRRHARGSASPVS